MIEIEGYVTVPTFERIQREIMENKEMPIQTLPDFLIYQKSDKHSSRAIRITIEELDND